MFLLISVYKSSFMDILGISRRRIDTMTGHHIKKLHSRHRKIVAMNPFGKRSMHEAIGHELTNLAQLGALMHWQSCLEYDKIAHHAPK